MHSWACAAQWKRMCLLVAGGHTFSWYYKKFFYVKLDRTLGPTVPCVLPVPHESWVFFFFFLFTHSACPWSTRKENSCVVLHYWPIQASDFSLFSSILANLGNHQPVVLLIWVEKVYVMWHIWNKMELQEAQSNEKPYKIALPSSLIFAFIFGFQFLQIAIFLMWFQINGLRDLLKDSRLNLYKANVINIVLIPYYDLVSPSHICAHLFGTQFQSISLLTPRPPRPSPPSSSQIYLKFHKFPVFLFSRVKVMYLLGFAGILIRIHIAASFSYNLLLSLAQKITHCIKQYSYFQKLKEYPWSWWTCLQGIY